jgi:hypothetical protein
VSLKTIVQALALFRVECDNAGLAFDDDVSVVHNCLEGVMFQTFMTFRSQNETFTTEEAFVELKNGLTPHPGMSLKHVNSLPRAFTRGRNSSRNS